jgi:HlyD family secretion protein
MSTAAPPPRQRLLRRVVVALLILAAAGAGAAWWLTRPPAIPASIAVANGRLEMDELDIQTKFAGRIASVMVDEGDVVRAGDVLAQMDVSDLQAQLARANDDMTQAQHAVAVARMDLEQAKSAQALAEAEIARTSTLVGHGFATRELLDQRRQQLNAATAAAHGVESRINAAIAAGESARHAAQLIEINIADNTLRAPRDAIVQYRLANVGEVLPVGGKVFTVLDVNYAYMDVFLPTRQAGRTADGTEARIVLDARRNRSLASHVTFVASENQFTPKMVETAAERDKLMFRVRVRVDVAALATSGGLQAGEPGVAYLRLDKDAPWPKAAAAPTP